jgi:hypothetical protein
MLRCVWKVCFKTLYQPNNWFLLRLVKSAYCCRYVVMKNVNTKLGIHLGTFSHKQHFSQSSVWPTDRPTDNTVRQCRPQQLGYSHFTRLCKVTMPATETSMFRTVTSLKPFIPYSFIFRYDWAPLGHLHISKAVFFNSHVPYVNIESESPPAFRINFSNVQSAVCLSVPSCFQGHTVLLLLTRPATLTSYVTH